YSVRSIGDVNSDQVGEALVGTQYYGGIGGKVYCLDADGDVTGVAPVAELSCGIAGEAVVLSWDFDEAAVLAGFNVYRMIVEEIESPAALRERLMERGTFSVREALAERAGLGAGSGGRERGFVRLNDELVQGCSYTDASAVDGTLYSYMVGAVTGDGSEVLTGPVEVLADFRVGELWLAHATPNPFRASASLEFAVPAGARAELGIYTPGGRLVRSLAAGEGRGTVVWDGLSDEHEPVAPGVYFVRLKAAGTSAHRKVVLLR
ncbi:MAG: T9SS type A sorting domain-containing protein, partial [Gemmatimonadota bacterium]